MPLEQAPGIKQVLAKIREDFRVWAKVGAWEPSFKKFVHLMLFSPGFQFTLSLRLQEIFGYIPLIGKLMRRLLCYGTTIFFGSEVNIMARIGAGVYIPHPLGIVIGEGVKIGNYVTLFQGITLGRRNYRKAECPIVKDHAIIYAGAKVFGRIVIGDKAVVGSNAVVLVDVPDGCAVFGIPAEIISRPKQPL